MPDKRKTLVLLDAHAVLHRAFHALPNFTSPEGEPTGALYGFSAFLLKIIRELGPDYIAAAYDLPEPTFRHAAYEGYKAKRPKMDDVLAVQINRSREILKAFNIPVYNVEGFEADDILGTIVEKIKSHPAVSGAKVKSIVASGDLDTLQLVRNDDVVVYTLKRGIQDTVIYDEKKVVERFGFKPELVPDFKALKGDPSDNIIGVKGIGDKSATELIKKYGTIEDIFKKLKKGEIEAKPRVMELLKKGEEEALFSKTLAEIRKDAPVNFSLEDSNWKKNFTAAGAEKIFNELGFKSLIKRLPNADDKTETKAEKPVVPEKLYKEVESPLLKILSEMEKTGILLDVGYLKQLSQKSRKELDSLEKAIWKLAGEEFNVNSPKQTGIILFEKLDLGGSKVKRTVTGSYSTNIAELMKLKGKHEIVDKIIEHRELAKLVSTYIDALPVLADKDNRLHTNFDSFGTATGRISSQNPNLQNIPKRSERGREVRMAFIADKGFKLVDFDYSQIDLRVAAILSGDKNLAEIFIKGEDVHGSTAARVFKVKQENVTPEMRRKIKVINFGILYGMGVGTLRRNLNCSKKEAQEFYDEYFSNFSGLKDYIERTKKFAQENGWTETLFGRRRYYPEIQSPEDYIQKEAQRMAVNMPIQGTAADFIKLAMVRADRALKEAGIKDKARLLLQIHDELLFEIKKELVAKAAPIIIEAMENVHPTKDFICSRMYKPEELEEIAQRNIPLKVNAEIGDNWEEMEELTIGQNN